MSVCSIYDCTSNYLGDGSGCPLLTKHNYWLYVRVEMIVELCPVMTIAGHCESCARQILPCRGADLVELKPNSSFPVKEVRRSGRRVFYRLSVEYRTCGGELSLQYYSDVTGIPACG